MGRVLFGFALLFALLVLAARLIWGGGTDTLFAAGAPQLDDEELEVHFQFGQPPAGLALARTGALFITVEPSSSGDDNQLLRMTDGVGLPYPTSAAQQTDFTAASDVALTSDGRLLVVDHGNYGTATPSLTIYDATSAEKLERYDLSSVAPLGSHVSAVVSTPDGRFALIADAGTWRREAALIIVDTRSGAVRRELVGHPAISAQKIRLTPGSGPMQYFFGTLTWRPGLASLSIDPTGEWLYLAATANDGLYRIALSALFDPQQAAVSALERYADKPASGAMLAVSADTVLVTDVNEHALLKIGSNRRAQTLVRTSQIRWAADLALQDDGSLLIADSALPLYLMQGEAAVEQAAPYFVLRINDLASRLD